VTPGLGGIDFAGLPAAGECMRGISPQYTALANTEEIRVQI
jgi:hypothetical protein